MIRTFQVAAEHPIRLAILSTFGVGWTVFVNPELCLYLELTDWDYYFGVLAVALFLGWCMSL